ncbi:MAG: hypothetical protein UZ22_OP11002000702 [Microgenomates bacterium OLB23]|nr:MAG: hypothetical protein UZ22_OP11002000702 [Microgenomates bacterium OLB23]
MRAMQYLYYSLVSVTPLIMFHRTSELFEFNKMLFIYAVTGFIIVLWVTRMLLSRSIIIKNTLFSPLLLFFFASQLLATVFSIDPWTSFFGYYGRFNGGLLSIFCYIALYQAFVSNFTGVQLQQSVRGIFKFSLLGSILVMLWGLPSKFGYDLSCLLFTGKLDVACWTDQFKPTIRVFSTLGQPNWLGSYISVNFFIGLYFLSNTVSRINWRSLLYALYLSSNFAMLLLTRSRSSLIGTLIGLALFIFYLCIQHRHALMSKTYKKRHTAFCGCNACIYYPGKNRHCTD